MGFLFFPWILPPLLPLRPPRPSVAPLARFILNSSQPPFSHLTYHSTTHQHQLPYLSQHDYSSQLHFSRPSLITSSSQSHFSHPTYHNSPISHHNSSPLHFLARLITAHHSSTSPTSLLNLTYHILTSHITYHITTHHSSTPHTSLIILRTAHITYHISTYHNSTSYTALIILSQHNSLQLHDWRTAFRVAGAIHRASWRSCGARGR